VQGIITSPFPVDFTAAPLFRSAAKFYLHPLYSQNRPL
jgi:hypothetical protein